MGAGVAPIRRYVASGVVVRVERLCSSADVALSVDVEALLADRVVDPLGVRYSALVDLELLDDTRLLGDLDVLGRDRDADRLALLVRHVVGRRGAIDRVAPDLDLLTLNGDVERLALLDDVLADPDLARLFTPRVRAKLLLGPGQPRAVLGERPGRARGRVTVPVRGGRGGFAVPVGRATALGDGVPAHRVDRILRHVEHHGAVAVDRLDFPEGDEQVLREDEAFSDVDVVRADLGDVADLLVVRADYGGSRLDLGGVLHIRLRLLEWGYDSIVVLLGPLAPVTGMPGVAPVCREVTPVRAAAAQSLPPRRGRLLSRGDCR